MKSESSYIGSEIFSEANGIFNLTLKIIKFSQSLLQSTSKF